MCDPRVCACGCLSLHTSKSLYEYTCVGYTSLCICLFNRYTIHCFSISVDVFLGHLSLCMFWGRDEGWRKEFCYIEYWEF